MNVYAPPPAHSPTSRTTTAGYAHHQTDRVGYAPPVQIPVQRHVQSRPSAGPVQFFGFVTAVLLVGTALVTAVFAGLITRFIVARERDMAQVEALLASPGQTLLSLFMYLLFGLCGVSFAVWLLLATQNVRSWGTRVRKAPGWAFGAWFIPFVSWWWPKQMVDDVWRGSHPDVPAGTPLHLVPKPGLSTAWWATWLLPSILINVGTVRAMWPVIDGVQEAMRNNTAPVPVVDPLQLLDTLAIWGLWAYVLWTVCALAAAVLVVQVTLWQRARLRAQP